MVSETGEYFRASPSIMESDIGCGAGVMELDWQTCEQARLAKDARFDGRFFTGVLTTGIFCRPVCPAPVPNVDNVRYFPSAAAASEAGFRPCRSEEHTSELQSLMRISYAVFCLKKKR